MKIKSLLVMAMCAATALSSCNSTKKQQEIQDNPEDAKILVAYFSATGTTKKVAEEVSKVFDATLFEIEPVQPYTPEDLDWRDSTSRSTIEMREDLSIRPEIKNRVEDMEQYDVVFLGYPIWWYIAPTIINSFVDQYDWSGKKVICFATSGSSPIEPCVENLKKQYPNIDWLPGKLLNNATTAQLEEWKKELNL